MNFSIEREDVLMQFITEALDNMDQAEATILELEQSLEDGFDSNSEKVQLLFRLFHNLKGSSGFLGLESVILLAHEVETALDRVRNKEKIISSSLTEIMIRVIDELKNLLKEIETKKKNVNLSSSGLEVLEKIKKEAMSEKQRQPKKKRFEIFEDEPSIDSKENKSSSEGMVKKEQENLHTAQESSFEKIISFTKKEIRVPEEKFNYLFNLMGELVIAESNVSQHPVAKTIRNDSFQSSINRLHKILKEFQEITLSLRMIPVLGLFQRMSRIVRDLQKKTNKRVNLQFYGEETQVDKSILDSLIEPIVHIVRNAFDHGIEGAEEREEKGKPAEGKIELHAFQYANEVWIVIKDDGRGLDKEKIQNKAIEKGLISKDVKVSDSEVFSFLFLHGFSTAEAITEVSGRGVGMDVVKTSIERLGGKIDIQTEKGQGTSFILRLPITLGIMEGTTFRIGNKFFTVPTVDLKEFVGLRGKEQILLENNTKVIDVRNQFIPIFDINEIFSYQEKIDYTSENSILLIFESDSKLIGLIAEEVMGNQSIVIKSMESNYEKAKEVSGFTILGDGSISLILDIKTVFKNLYS